MFRYRAPDRAQREVFERTRERMLVALEGIAADIPHSRPRGGRNACLDRGQGQRRPLAAAPDGARARLSALRRSGRPGAPPDPARLGVARPGDRVNRMRDRRLSPHFRLAEMLESRRGRADPEIWERQCCHQRPRPSCPLIVRPWATPSTTRSMRPLDAPSSSLESSSFWYRLATAPSGARALGDAEHLGRNQRVLGLGIRRQADRVRDRGVGVGPARQAAHDDAGPEPRQVLQVAAVGLQEGLARAVHLLTDPALAARRAGRGAFAAAKRAEQTVDLPTCKPNVADEALAVRAQLQAEDQVPVRHLLTSPR